MDFLRRNRLRIALAAANLVLALLSLRLLQGIESALLPMPRALVLEDPLATVTLLPGASLSPSPTTTPAPTPTAVPTPTQFRTTIDQQLEFKELTEGALVEMFPNANIYSSSRGDLVISDRMTGVRLAGQVVQTQYGVLTFLVSESYYQKGYEQWFGQSTSLIGYPDFTSLTPKDEFGRIFMTLAGMAHRETFLGGHLASYIPRTKNFISMQGALGESYKFAAMLPNGLYDPAATYMGGHSGILRSGDNNYIQTSASVSTFHSAHEFMDPERLEDEFLRELLQRSLRNGMWRMIRVMLYHPLGYDTVQFFNAVPSGENAIFLYTVFAPLFSHPEIQLGLGARWNEADPPRSVEISLEYREASLFGISELVEVNPDAFE